MSATRIVLAFGLSLLVGLVFLLCCLDGLRAQHSRSYYRHLEEEPPLKLELGLKLYKRTYLVWEPIWVRVTVTNVGEHAGKFYFKSLDGLVITDSAGTTYRAKLHIDRTLGEIQPQETREQEGNIFSYVVGLPLREGVAKVFCYLPPGRYTILYRLNQTGVSGGSLFAESAVDTFEVLDAHGEDSLALELLFESYDLEIEKKYDRLHQTLLELQEKYPNSEYVPYAMLKAAGTLQEWHEVIRRYPESGEAARAVRRILSHFASKKDKQGFIEDMDNLIKQYPDTDVARVALRLKNTSDRFFRERPKPDWQHREEGK